MEDTNKREHPEFNFVQLFVQTYQEKKKQGTYDKETLYSIQAPGVNQSTYADCEIVCGNAIIKVEAKLLNDTLGNSSSFYNLIGELIGVINKPSLLQTKGVTTKEISNGILIPEESKTKFVELWKKNIKPNGVKYCKAFNVKYLITFDESNKNIQLFSLAEESEEWKKQGDTI